MIDATELGRYGGTDPGHFATYLRYLRSCRRILDFGCGSGAFLRWAKVRELAAEGYEPDAVVREEARAGGTIVHGEMPDLTRFDALVLICLIEHLDRDELNALLAGFNGLLIIQSDEPRWREPWYLFKHRADFWDDPEHRRPFTPRGLLRLVESHGYSIIARGRVKPPRVRFWRLRSQLVRLRLWRFDRLYGIWSPHYIVARKGRPR